MGRLEEQAAAETERRVPLSDSLRIVAGAAMGVPRDRSTCLG
jgi:hypothetical protein